jgi:transposase InsO family protein
MTTSQKVELVASVQESHGLGPALAAVELAKSTWYYQQRDKVSYADKYAHLRPVLEQIAREHPAYGVPRTTVELREQYGLVVNHKVVRRLHRLWDLALLRTTRPAKPSPIRQVITMAGDRANLVAQLEEIGPLRVVYTDFTELLYADGRRKAYFMPILGHCCKVVYGWALSDSPDRTMALRAWQQAKAMLQSHNLSWKGMIIHHDQDPVYTSYAWTNQLLRQDRVRLSYALNGAKDNTFMESFFARFKTEGHSRFLAAEELDELHQIVAERVDYHNRSRRHSTLAHRTPLEALQQIRLACQGTNDLSVDSVDNLGQVNHPDHRPATAGQVKPPIGKLDLKKGS